MLSFLLIVGRPPKRNWNPPVAIKGEAAHYMYDITVRAGVRKDSQIFLYGTKGSGIHGLYASGICVDPDDKSIPQEKEHDAFLKLRHDCVLNAPMSLADLAARLADDSQLARSIEQTTFLRLIKLSEKEAEVLGSILDVSSHQP